MVDNAAKKRKLYFKDYQEKNQSKVKQIKTKYATHNKAIISQRNKKYYEENKSVCYENKSKRRKVNPQKTNEAQRDYRSRKKNNLTQVERILAFKREIIHGPNFTCYSCKRRLFKGQVNFLNSKKILELKSKLDRKKIRQLFLTFKRKEVIFCYNCLNSIKKGRIPAIHISNGLWLDPVPD